MTNFVHWRIPVLPYTGAAAWSKLATIHPGLTPLRSEEPLIGAH